MRVNLSIYCINYFCNKYVLLFNPCPLSLSKLSLSLSIYAVCTRTIQIRHHNIRSTPRFQDLIDSELNKPLAALTVATRLAYP
ncbi:hypothetical protein HanRHA438_Chr10g0438921 [Helianthus annuus]|nr:hypothetical protein HanRHA438_Chr10g0438921 [Helianthus annuus]KAJ0882611.1 hypothetical protein HanPSC8_Chr10g0411671 [Helianthus annuus]